jgi:nucleoid DNA-binding protein
MTMRRRHHAMLGGKRPSSHPAQHPSVACHRILFPRRKATIAFAPLAEDVSRATNFFFYRELAHRCPRAERLLNIDIMAKLTKRDIVVAISNQNGMVQHEVFDVVQRTLDKITDSLANNIAVELRNFGVFQPRLTKPRVGRNPNQPGSSFVIPPRVTVKFKAGKVMRQRVEKLSRELKEKEASEQQRTATPHRQD